MQSSPTTKPHWGRVVGHAQPSLPIPPRGNLQKDSIKNRQNEISISIGCCRRRRFVGCRTPDRHPASPDGADHRCN
ncbi:hypothetical protein evm_010452 [Chilo suppressalis]|nr:hypothetical protein evm_010452 [Chilo suppressalis]